MERGKHRDEWRKLCEVRIQDAEVLLRNGRYDAAYYLYRWNPDLMRDGLTNVF
jgi:hypothetical protein